MNKTINRHAGRIAAALLLGSSVGVSAWAGPLPDGGVTREEVAAVLKAGFSKKGVAPQRILDWNRDKRFGRAYLDKVGDPWVEMDVDVEHGATTEATPTISNVGRRSSRSSAPTSASRGSDPCGKGPRAEEAQAYDDPKAN
ncbi:MAG TPA: YbjN domain-containing protein [Reyranella sp.]|jgi:hypothetical protein